MRTRYQITKDFFSLYGCFLGVIYALKIATDITGIKFSYANIPENPYGFFAALLVLLIITPYTEKYGKRKTISDYFPEA